MTNEMISFMKYNKINVNPNGFRNRKIYKSIVKTLAGKVGEQRIKLCAICLKQCINCRPLQEKYEIYSDIFISDTSIEEIINDVLETNVQNPSFLTNVCEDCLQQLIASYIFLKRTKINRSILDRCIQELYESTKKSYPSPRVVPAHVEKQENILQINLKVRNFSSDLPIHNPEVNKNENNVKKIALIRKECTMCAQDFKSEDEFRTHQKLHPDGTTHICRKDGRIFKTSYALKRHTQRCHQHKEDYICPKCGKVLTSTTSLNRHLLVHNNIKLECPKCGKLFSTGALLKSHSKTHAKPEKLAVCDTCGKICKSADLLKAHSNSHKTKECPFCKKVLKVHTHFKYHIRKHETGIARSVKYRTTYNCNHCEYKSFNKKTLEAHINKVHLNVRPYICGLCGKSFYKNSNLVEHKLSHTEQTKQCCKSCGETFVNKKSLSEHMRLHSGERPYACDLCDQTFITAGRRSDHKRRKHLEKSEQCQLCDKKFSLKRELTRHIGKAHKENMQRCNSESV